MTDIVDTDTQSGAVMAEAVVCRAFGPIAQLRVERMPVPAPGAGRVRVRMRAAALNFMDTLMVQGLYQLKPPLPFVPGAEMAGIVTAAGAGVAADLVPGTPVLVRGSYGCLAEEPVVDAAQVLPIEEPRDWGVAAALSTAYTTAYHALVHRGAVQAGERVLVLGAAGGVGTAAIQVARALGAHVIAACAGPDRAAVCRQAGADATVDYTSGDLREQVRALAGPPGVQIVLDTVGSSYAEPALRSLGTQGRYLVVGFAAGEIPRLPANLLLLKGSSAIGVNADFSRTNYGLYRDTMALLLRWLAEGRLNPVIAQRLPLSRAVEAMERMARRGYHGKVVIEA